MDVAGNVVAYEILVNNYSATITGNNLIFTCPTDDFVLFTIRAYTSTKSVTFSFNVSITLLTNQLYINLKNRLNTFSSFFIVTPDFVTLSSGNIMQLSEYRGNSQELLGVNGVQYATPKVIDNNPVAEFKFDGSAYLNFGTPNSSSGYTFIVAYIRKAGQSGSAFLFGQTANNIFNSGNSGQLLANTFFGDVWANGSAKDITYVLPEESLSVVIFNCTDEVTINSIAKDRVFEDRSVKGSIAMFAIVDYKISPTFFSVIEKDIRTHYQPSRAVTLLNFDGTIVDQSYRGKTLFTSATVINYDTKKFGSGSYPLIKNGISNFIQIPNESDYSFLHTDFTIAGWFSIDRATNGEVVSLYSQQGLVLFLSGSSLYLGRSSIVGLSLFNIPISFSAINFNHFEIAKENGTLRLYLNGTKVYEVADNYEYRDYNTPVQLGQASVTTPNLNINLDSLVVYRQTALHNSPSFPLPTAPYS